MNHSAFRHVGNYVAVVCLLFAAAFGADHLALWLGWRPIAGCLLASVTILNQTVALWLVMVGALLALLGWHRRLGLVMILAGVAFSQLPGLLAAHLGPFCGCR